MAIISSSRARAVPRLLHRLGVDRALAYLLLGRVWSAISGPVTLFFIGSLLTRDEQGYYYTFASVLSLNAFFELGLATVLLQFASHEKADLHWTAQRTLAGTPEAKARLASLLRKAVRWYTIAALLMVLLIGPAGYFFFSSQPAGQLAVHWHGPWCLVVLFTAAAMVVGPVYAILEGCGVIHDMYLLRLLQAVAMTLSVCSSLLAGWALYTAACLQAANWAVGIVWLLVRYRKGLHDLWHFHHRGGYLRWWVEVWPMQWKIALSFASGYFIFQLFNPVLFKYHGPAAAGQMGFSLSLAGTVGGLGLCWLSPKYALFGALVAKRAYRELDRIFFRSLWLALGIGTLGGLAVWGGAVLLQHWGHPLGQRCLPPLPLLFLVLTTVIQIVVFAEAGYLRAHKQEPFLGLSLLCGVLIALNTFLLGRLFGPMAMCAGYFLVTLVVSLGGGTWVFLKKRREWQACT